MSPCVRGKHTVGGIWSLDHLLPLPLVCLHGDFLCYHFTKHSASQVFISSRNLLVQSRHFDDLLVYNLLQGLYLDCFSFIYLDSE